MKSRKSWVTPVRNLGLFQIIYYQMIKTQEKLVKTFQRMSILEFM